MDTEPFLINMINFDGKKVLIRPSAVDKGKAKEVIIGDTRKADEKNKNSCKKVVALRTSDGGETLKVTITTSNAGGAGAGRWLGMGAYPTHRGRSDTQTWTVDGHCRTIRIIPVDGPATPRSPDDHVPSNHDD